MDNAGSVVVIGGTAGIGKEVARFYAKRGRGVVISGRDKGRAAGVASEIGGRTRGVGLDLARPQEIAKNLSDVGKVDYLVISAIERDQNTVREYDVTRAIRLATLKLVGYTEVVHALVSRLGKESSVLLFGGLAKERPYPGSTTVTTVNGGGTALVRTMAIELAPVRGDGIHPGIVGDSPYWADKHEAIERARSRTPTGRLATMQDITAAVVALLENPGINGVDLYVDGGWVLL